MEKIVDAYFSFIAWTVFFPHMSIQAINRRIDYCHKHPTEEICIIKSTKPCDYDENGAGAIYCPEPNKK